MPVVYRIQDSEGRGPFKPGFSESWVQSRSDHENLLPWIVEFGRIDTQVLIGETAGSACRNLEQLRRWFTKCEYKKLMKFGYRAIEMNVNRIITESEIQCFVGRSKPFCEEIKKVKLY